ncbi:MAG: DUF2723 domain-containing protein [bacterium]
MNIKSSTLISSITGLIAFILISILGAPGLYWGESAVITARAWQLGGSHPPGYPGFLQLVHCGQTWLPLGDLAFRANMIGWITLGIVTGLLCKIFLDWNLSAGISLFSALGFSLLSSVIDATSSVEVYGLHLILILLIILLNASYKLSNRSFYLTIFIAALALTHHLTFVLLLPGLAIWVYIDRRKQLKQSHLVPAIVFALSGFALYIYLPLRHSLKPVSVWGNPSSWRGFIKLVTAFEEARGSFRSGMSQWAAIRLRSWYILGLIREKITFPGLLLVVPGCVGLYRRSKGLVFFMLISFFILTASVLLYDSRETESFYLPGLLFLWIFLTSGLGELLRIVQKKKLIQNQLFLILLTLVPIVLSISNLLQSLPFRLTEVEVPRKMTQMSLDIFSNDGLVVSQRSDWCFLHWYLVDIEKRSNAEIVFQPLLSFYWYYESLVAKGLMEGFLHENDFEDSWSWNSAVTASLVAQNKDRRKIRLAEQRVLEDIISAGFHSSNPDCSLFGLEIGRVDRYERRWSVPTFSAMGRLDPVSRNAVGALYYNHGLCLEKTGRLDESRSAFNRAMTYQDYGNQ